jgi:hypothetical protein
MSNLSKACKVMGYSRDSLYRCKEVVSLDSVPLAKEKMLAA